MECIHSHMHPICSTLLNSYLQGVHPDRRTIATGQVGKDPVVIVWDSVDCTELMRLPQGYGNRGVTALCFSPDGTKLVCICTDNNHTMYIWDWKRKKVGGGQTLP